MTDTADAVIIGGGSRFRPDSRMTEGASGAGYNGLAMSSTPPPFAMQQVADAIRAGLNGRADTEASPGEFEELSATYRGNLHHYREHVQKSLAEGDYLQAAEKSWGAYAQAIKIIGADHGLHIASHRSILRVADRLTALVGQTEDATAAALANGLLVARAMHTHFYENDLPGPTVVAGAGTVSTTIDLLQQLFQGNGTGGGDHGDADT